MVETDIREAYSISPVRAGLDRLIPPRRAPFPCLAPIWESSFRSNDDEDAPPDDDTPMARVTNAESWTLTDNMLNFAGLSDFAGCATFERAHPTRRGWAKRPVTHVSRAEERASLLHVFDALGEQFYAWIKENVKPEYQTYDKKSRLGAPYYEIREDKIEVLLPEFDKLFHDDLSVFDQPDIFIINNVRLQPERRSKTREFIFINANNEPYRELVGEKERLDPKFKRVASRQRLVYNWPAAPNLFCQIADTSIHNLFLRYPTFHHNMTRRVGHPLRGYALFIDAVHFERNIGVVVERRAELLGGLYERITRRLLKVPYLVPTDAGGVVSLRVRREAGWIEQLGSGISSVAPIAKEMFALLYTYYYMKVRGKSFAQALQLVLQGGDAQLSILNYGDDNVLYGDRSAAQECFSFLAQYLKVEQEEPKKFLGYYYTQEDGFFLSRASYLLNFYLAERAPKSRFRPYPFLGRKLRREVFRREGEPFLREKAFAEEDKLLARYGYTESLMLEAAERERARAALSPTEINEKYILGKEYLLTSEEKALDRDRFSVLSPTQTLPYLNKLLGVTK